MRRTDREVRDPETIVRIIEECPVMRIGLSDGEFPYIVPVNFAYEYSDGKFFLYFHRALAGRKYELLKQNGKCSFEMDRQISVKLMPENRGVTTLYRSVMGNADVVFLEGSEKNEALKKLMGRYEESRGFDCDFSCMRETAAVKLCVTEISAKENM